MLDEAIEYLKTLQLQVQVMLCSLRQKKCISPPNLEGVIVSNIQVTYPSISQILQIMSMGAGLFMPPMMFPGGMQPMNAPHIYSPMGVGMGMGFGIGIPDMNGGSPGYPIVQVPHIQGTHFPSPSIPGQTVMHGMAGSNFQVLGIPSQGLPMPMPMPRGPIPPFSGRPFMTSSGMAVAPMENTGSAAACSSKDASQNINSPMLPNGGTETSITPAPRQVCRLLLILERKFYFT